MLIKWILDFAQIFTGSRLVEIQFFVILSDCKEDVFKFYEHPMTGILFQNQRIEMTPPKSNIDTNNYDRTMVSPFNRGRLVASNGELPSSSAL